MGHSSFPDRAGQRGVHAPSGGGGARPPHPARARRGGTRRPRRRPAGRSHDRRRVGPYGAEHRRDRCRHRGPDGRRAGAGPDARVTVDIHEYQAKELLSGFGVPVPKGGVAYSAEQAVYRATEVGGTRWVVKAQIHSGARGRAGGVKVCTTDADVRQAAKDLLGKTLVTVQTGPEGLPVHRLLVEQALPIARELYVGLVLDRKRERIVVVAHPHGGIEIEEIAQREPEAILREVVEPAVGMRPFQARELAFGLGLAPAQLTQAVAAILGAYRAFRDLDATMVEMNPLVVTKEGQVLALDVKMSFDDNAMFRRPNVAELRDYAQEDPREAEAAEHGLNYVALDGDIGCIINGAGLAMATMDMIKHAGGEPANFLDIGGGASPDRVAAAFRLVLADKNVEAMLVNIFAGINRCDWVAQGVVQATRETQLTIPLVVRLAGTNVEEGRRILQEGGVGVGTAEALADAAGPGVAAPNKGAPEPGTVRHCGHEPPARREDA